MCQWPSDYPGIPDFPSSVEITVAQK